MNRKPNAGPYVIDYTDYHGKAFSQERHLWADACALMRELLIANFQNITIRFA